MSEETRLVPRTVARIACIQAHYQWLMRPNQSIADIVQEFTTHRFQGSTYPMGWDEEALIDVDFFHHLVPLVADHVDRVDEVVPQFLPSNWVVECMDPTIRALFRCGATEALKNTFVPKPVVMNEYMISARALLLPNHWGMVNAVLDKAFQVLRPDNPMPTDSSTPPVPPVS
jgi:transcription termination factor NusB